MEHGGNRIDWKAEALRWRQEALELRSLVEELRTEVAALRADNAELHAENKALGEENAELAAKVEGLERQNEQLLRKVLGPTSEKMPPIDRELRRREKAKKKNGKKRRKDNAAARAKLETQEVSLPVPDDQRECPNCPELAIGAVQRFPDHRSRQLSAIESEVEEAALGIRRSNHHVRRDLFGYLRCDRSRRLPQHAREREARHRQLAHVRPRRSLKQDRGVRSTKRLEGCLNASRDMCLDLSDVVEHLTNHRSRLHRPSSSAETHEDQRSRFREQVVYARRVAIARSSPLPDRP